MQAGLKDVLSKKLSSDELRMVEDFVDQGFVHNAEVSIASLFLHAKEKDRNLKEVMLACEKEWEEIWQFEHREIRGGNEYVLQNLHAQFVV